MNDIVISVRQLSKCYQVFDSQRDRLRHVLQPRQQKGMQQVWALRDVSFDIRRGEAVALIGRNGGGKSTLLEILTGTLTPSGGSVQTHGRISALLELGSGFNPEYTGRDNVVLNGLLLGLSRKEILGRFAEIEAFAEIGDAMERPVKCYSSGMIMRLAFAVQVLCDPDILIIDEALSVGDFFFQQKCLSHIRALCARGVTLLFVSHDMGTVRDICTRGIFLQQGRVMFDGGNLEAIRRYLSHGPHNPPRAEACAASAADQSAMGAPLAALTDALWRASAPSAATSSGHGARLLAVGVYDAQGAPAVSARIGAEITVAVHYQTLGADPVHIQLVLKNKYSQIVTSVGSNNLKTPLPALTPGQDAIFEIRLRLMLEGGLYGMRISLGRLLGGNGSDMLDESPWLGPLEVEWHYQEEVPPFFGMVGLPASGHFRGAAPA
jgi:lipopolysaccharide transport system ATP-binding protein